MLYAHSEEVLFLRFVVAREPYQRPSKVNNTSSSTTMGTAKKKKEAKVEADKEPQYPADKDGNSIYITLLAAKEPFGEGKQEAYLLLQTRRVEDFPPDRKTPMTEGEAWAEMRLIIMDEMHELLNQNKPEECSEPLEPDIKSEESSGPGFFDASYGRLFH
jgi:hypothetical protein